MAKGFISGLSTFGRAALYVGERQAFVEAAKIAKNAGRDIASLRRRGALFRALGGSALGGAFWGAGIGGAYTALTTGDFWRGAKTGAFYGAFTGAGLRTWNLLGGLKGVTTGWRLAQGDLSARAVASRWRWQLMGRRPPGVGRPPGAATINANAAAGAGAAIHANW